MAATKEKHYWTQLRIALTSGQWDASTPGRAPNAAPLSWSELLRKFRKHCIGHADTAELASQTQALSLLLAANASDQSLDGNDVTSPSPLELGQECMLAEERMPEALVGYNTLKSLESSNTEVKYLFNVSTFVLMSQHSLYVLRWLTTPTHSDIPLNAYPYYRNQRISRTCNREYNLLELFTPQLQRFRFPGALTALLRLGQAALLLLLLQQLRYLTLMKVLHGLQQRPYVALVSMVSLQFRFECLIAHLSVELRNVPREDITF